MGGRIKVLATIQGFVGVTAVAGGALLAAAPSGRYLAGDPAVLVHTPFHDFFVPGVLLAVFVGGGGLLAAALTWSRMAVMPEESARPSDEPDPEVPTRARMRS